MNGQCHIIQQYRADLKENVTKALKFGELHRNEYNKLQSGFIMRDEDFPKFDKSKTTRSLLWNREQTETEINITSHSTRLLLGINEDVMEMRESNERVTEKLEKFSVQVK